MMRSSALILLLTVYIFISNTCLSAKVLAGIDILGTQHPKIVSGKNICLYTTRSAYDSNFNHVIDRLSKATSIKTIITGQRYFRSYIPDPSGKQFDAVTNAEIIIYRDPSQKLDPSVLSSSDALVIDFQDIGIRFFKGITILAQLLDLAKDAGKPVIILDRPNPIGGNIVSGPVVKVDLRSKFGVFPIPLVYGMTIGELGLLFNKEFGIGAELTVIGMENYKRALSYNDTGMYWIPPSSHIPEPTSPLYYATTGVLGELGVFSTGVGTTRPFHYVLAPWIDGEILAEELNKMNIKGVKFLPTTEKPFYGLFSNKEVYGVEIVITDTSYFDPFLCGTAILSCLYRLYPQQIPLNNKICAEAFDTLSGDRKVRQSIIAGTELSFINDSLQKDLKNFLQIRQKYLIYNN